MARPKRRQFKFDEESVNKLFQEIYDDNHNIKAKIIRLFNKWEVKVKEAGEVAAIGEQIIKLIMAESKNQDQKIMLLKYLKEVVFDRKDGTSSNNRSNSDDDNAEVSTERKNQLLSMVQNELEKKSKEK